MMSSAEESVVRQRISGKESNVVAPVGGEAQQKENLTDIAKEIYCKEPEFMHSGVLLTSLAPPLGIMFAFGDRTALLVLCFGAIITYIFDILGSVEVSENKLSRQ
jgi:hypothetical protein